MFRRDIAPDVRPHHITTIPYRVNSPPYNQMPEPSQSLPRRLNWFLSILAAVVTGLVGLLTSGLGTIAYVEWFHVSSFEGASGYLIIGNALLGSIISTFLGLIITRTVAAGASPGFWKAVAISTGTVLGTVGLVTLVLYVLAGAPTISGPHIQPELTPMEYEAARAVDTQSEFDAIAFDAPLSAWLPYTQEGQEESRRAVAIERMASKEGFSTELGALMLNADARQAEAALRLIAQLPAPEATLIPPVTNAGRDLIARMEKANATTPEQDPRGEAVADVSIRFSAWMEAVRALREKTHGDFIPELEKILELSRLRSDSQVMQQDVCRVASFYLSSWTGIDPLPGDPPPK